MIDLKLGDVFELTVDDFAGVSCVLTDPPYGISLDSNCKRGVKGRKSTYKIQGDESMDAGNHVLRLALEAGVKTIIFFASPSKPWPGTWRNTVIWDKGGGTGFGGDPSTCLRRTYEIIQISNKTKIKKRDESVWRMPPNNRDYTIHPCIKPVPLIMRLLDVFDCGDLVFDPFSGSGSTAIACMHKEINFKGLEIDETYFNKAMKRINDEKSNNLFSDSGSQRLQGGQITGNNEENRTESKDELIAGCGRGVSWFEAEPGLDRVVNGFPGRIHRLKGLGNAQVPLQAAVAWKLLGGE